MKLFDISIKNFRGIAELQHLKVGSINSFVGKNDSGKSCILKALDAFFNDKFTSNDVYKGIPEGEITTIAIRFSPEEDIDPLCLDRDGKIHLKKTFAFNSSVKLVKESYYVCNDINHANIGNCWGVKEADING